MSINNTVKKGVTKEIQNHLIRIYNDIFLALSDLSQVNIFLCGGASTSSKKSIRDLLRIELEKERFLKVLYPEDLLIDLLNRNKNKNLLELEGFLADNSDIICIISESPGSFAELGAFVTDATIKNKVVAVVQSSFKRAKSFIMLGPIRLLMNMDKNKVIFFKKNDLNGLKKDLMKNVIKPAKNKKDNIRLDSIFGVDRIILLINYFYTGVTSEFIRDCLNFLFKQYLNGSTNNLQVLYKSALKQLYKDKLIQKNSNSNSFVYELTKEGFKEIHFIMDNLYFHNSSRLFDELRFDIMTYSYYSQ
ncbi:retron St85 family effector protein [Sporolactobacillus laevolacticus]|uniref:UDP-3-O-(3-hydroxymyristoyl) glucosamine N-acyltransferase n=1 Tax=Sporolactobacillus laevolacticus DSM 442 TaxID=1395513 RepID=V6J115_9BACL|nr:retron St85 family effector protein [Sporolactobacillus laevolacticus]EST13505.1 UDP-3-O-(3-hydroxymyristoyl) glucosamine N-acyltransferase [Sporolactobacillus laevolacticus DSM 442]